MQQGYAPARPPAALTSPAAPPSVTRDEAARAELAAALLSHDLSDEPLDPSLPILSSAVLQPFRHLLDRPAPSPPSLSGSFELVDAPDAPEGRVLPGQYAAPTDAALSDAGSPLARRASLAGSAVWSAHGFDAPPEPLELSADEEERLASEWGLDEALSNAASDDGAGRRRGSSAVLEPTASAFGVSRAFSAGAAAAASSGTFGAARRHGPGAGLDDEEDDDALEVLETRSMPDALNHGRPLSFAESILDGVEQRLAASTSGHASSTSPLVSVEAAGAATSEGESSAPRIKILERTPTQRRRLGQRLRTQSLGPAAGMSSLPSLADLSGDGSVGDIETLSSAGRSGLAVRDSLFLGPALSGLSRQGSAASPRLSTAMSSSRGSTDLDRASSFRPDSRLSLAIPPSRSDELAHPDDRPSTSPTLSRASPGFTSRFDPLVIAAQRAELAKERPAFSNPDAGKPPQVVLLPAPLAGRPPSPPRRERVEGPEPEGLSDGDDEEDDPAQLEEDGDGEDEFEDAPGLRKPLHPAGALYGRSLMDVMAERRAQLKAQQRAFVPGSDGRRAMFEWQASSPAPPSDAVAVEQEQVDDVPLALVPAGGRGRAPPQRALGASPEKARGARTTIFGPDLLYQRELARAKELEEQERVEREEFERREREKREQDERKKRRGKLVKGAKRRSQMALDQVAAAAPAQEWEPPVAELRQEEREWEPEQGEEVVEELVEAPTRRHAPAAPLDRRNSLAPSLSIPLGLGTGLTSSASGGDWFPALADSTRARAAGSDDEDEQGDAFRPRPISSLGGGGYFSAGGEARRKSAFGMSDDEDDEVSDDEETGPTRRTPADAQHLAPATGATSSNARAPLDGPRLPFPGDPSSQGHESHDHPDSDDDDQPLGGRYSRQSLAHILPPVDHGAAADDDSEDDKPLGARFSTIQPVPDEDDIPLAIRRMSLAPQQRLEAPTARLHALDDDGRTVSDESDDRPLGLKAGGHLGGGGAPIPTYPYQQHPHALPGMPLAPGYPPVARALPYSHSHFSLAAPTLAGFGGVAPDPQAQLALAQMQMQAAMQKQASDPIERWRNEVAP
ncbi:hypothetical protein JCM3775_006372 [Rhodotorula graminis]